jgi:hypothetical protein
VDNNFTRKVSLTDATWIASVKGLVSGIVNLGIAFSLGAQVPALSNVAGAMAVGFLAYGVSLALFVVGLRHLGAARTGAYFSVAPFIGAVIAVSMGETIAPQLIVAGALMAAGVWLHLTERHEHAHTHQELWHEHEHVHDEHHQHGHPDASTPSGKHTHLHGHSALRHTHPHFPDAHHRHEH